MKVKSYILLGAALLMSSPAWSATIYGGFEDTSGSGSDYDYNDIVFSISSTSLALNLNGASLIAKPVLLAGTGAHGEVGTPFWNNTTLDNNPQDNVGWCIYGGGSAGECGGATVPLDAAALYVATNASSTGSANNITFTETGQIAASIVVTITAAGDSLGYYNISDHVIHTIGSGAGSFTFTPNGDFGLVGVTNSGGPNTYFSQTSVGGTQDVVSHFAFFENAPVVTGAPEPSTLALFGAGFLGLSFLRNRRKV